jgi:hypothetical protein
VCAKRAPLARLRDDVGDSWLVALDDFDSAVKRRAELIRSQSGRSL